MKQYIEKNKNICYIKNSLSSTNKSIKGEKKMKQKKVVIGKSVVAIILVISILLAVQFATVVANKNNEIVGKIYFNKPVSWEQAYAYLCDEKGKELLGKWPGIELIKEEDYIHSFEVTSKIGNKIDECKVTFNNGDKYAVEEECQGYNKIYDLTSGIGEKNKRNSGKWLDYSENIKIGKIPATESKIKNVIYMIGDGMGENHISAGEIYKGEKLNIQNIKNKTQVKTASLSTVTDSAASATALATGYKTTNGAIGKDKNKNDVENLIEYSNRKNMKTGIVCTQILNHATPAAFSVHNTYRYNYDQIAASQIESCLDLMLGGGRKYFSNYKSRIAHNNYKWVNQISELENVDKNERVIGTFAEDSISKENNRTNLSEMAEEAIARLENENGFFLMIEGSDIDSYSHEQNMDKMLIEMIDFDDAVKVAMSYVDTNPDTLLIVTADHETGGLKVDKSMHKEQLTNKLFTTTEHTETNVALYAYGIGANDITEYDIIDNTSIYKFIKQGIDNNYKQ